ncbi:hypothetical protein ACFQPA_08695 [Halomarina halobia]|uniref:Uncharacterized protein n=1 Tax=Halomarina halobia TaxID=3033386 RepID=A0ABD6AC02_9EURY|nr:hypothetical protein [Halomarina sp. PSR21]
MSPDDASSGNGEGFPLDRADEQRLVGENRRFVRGQLHLPEYTTGCYHERLDDCCWLCFFRITSSTLVRALRR